MNKIFSKIAVVAVGAAMAIGVGVAASKKIARADAAVSNTPMYESGTPDWGTSYTNGEKTLNSVNWYATCVGNTSSIGWNSDKQRGTNDSAEKGPLASISETSKYGLYQTSGDFSKAAKITVTVSNSDSVTGTWYIYTSTDAGANWTEATTGTLTASTTTLEFNNGSAIGESVRFAFGFGTAKTTKTRISLANIAVYAEIEDKDIESIEASDVAMYAGEVKDVLISANPEGAQLPSDLVYTIDDPTIISISNGAITGLKSGSTSVEVHSEATPTLTDTFTVTVSAYPLEGLEVGKRYAIIGTYTPDGGTATNYQLTALNTAGTTPFADATAYEGSYDSSIYVEVEEGLREGTVAFKLGDDYLAWESGNSLKGVASVNESSSWVVTLNESVLEIVNLSTFGSLSPRYLRLNGYNTRFACYTSGQNPVEFVEISTDPAFTLSASTTSLSAGESATITSELLNGATGVVSYSNSNESVLTLVDNGDGTATVTAQSLPTNATATITGTLVGCADQSIEFSVAKDVAVNGIIIVSGPTKDTYYVDDSILDTDGLEVNKTYEDGTQDPVDIADLEFDFDFGQVGDTEVTVTYLTFGATFHVNVVERPVIETMTVAEALAAIAELADPEASKTTYGAEATVHGFVTSLGSWSDSYGNADVYIADEKGGTPTLQILRFKDKTIFDQLVAGAEINAAGQLAKYNANGTIKSELVAPKDGAIAIEIVALPEIDKLTVAEALTRGAALAEPAATDKAATTYDSETVDVTGYVTRKNSWSEQYGNADIYIADEKGGTPALQVLRVSDKTIFDQLVLGTKVEVRGIIAKYKKNSSTASVIELTSPVVTILEQPVISQLTVAEAIARGEALAEPEAGESSAATTYDTETVKVRGYVVRVDVWNSKYGQADIYIADAVNGSPSLQVFRYSNFDVYKTIVLGAQVNVEGQLAKYKKNASTASVIEFTTPTITVESAPSITELTFAEALARGEALEAPGSGATTYDTETIKLSGYVVSKSAWNEGTSYANGELYISATADGTSTIQLYHVFDKEVFDAAEVGALVEAQGILAKYQPTSGDPKIELTAPITTVKEAAPVLLKDLKYEGTPKDTYYVGETFDINTCGITKFVASYTKGDDADVALDAVAVDLDLFDTSAPGEFLIKFTYSEVDKGEVSVEIIGNVIPAPTPCTVIFDNNGGTGTMTPITNVNVGDSITLPSADELLAPAGQQFKAWEIDSVEYLPGASYTLAAEEVTIKAIWEDIPAPAPTLVDIIVTPSVFEYGLNGVIDKDTLTVMGSFSDGTERELASNEYVLIYDFSTPGDDVVVTVDAGEGVVATYNVTVIDTPAPTPCTITFDVNGGTGTMTPIEGKSVGQSITLPSAAELTPPAGKEFDAWEIDGERYLVGASYTLESSAVTIKALWKDATPTPVACTITFDNNGGTGTMAPITGKNVGDTITLPSAAALTAPSGKEFKAWEINGVEYQVGASYVLAASEVTIKALWKDATPVPPAPKTLTGIEVTPTVFEYNVGDVIDKSTITVVAIYSDGSRETIAASQFEALINTASAGDSVAVTINYGGKTYTYNVSVKAVEEAKKGCRGSVVATSAILSILSLAGVALLSVKKRKED